MLLKILGWFWVITGIIFFLKPLFLREQIKKKSLKKIKKIFFGIALILGLLLIKATWGVPGLVAKIVMICGFIAILKGLFFLKTNAANHVIAWLLEQPLRNFRFYAAGQILFGAVILSI